jgi:hypothetical protein
MTTLRIPKRRFPASGAHRTVDIHLQPRVVTSQTIRNALKHFAVLLCVFGLTLPRAEYGRTTEKPRVNFAMNSGANGQRKTSSAPMKRLIDALAGEWSTKITYEPSEQMPQGGSGLSRDSYRVGPARSSLIEEYHAEGAQGKSWGTGVFWWDEPANGFRFVWCDSFAIDAGCRVSSGLGNWNGDTLVMIDSHEVSGKPVFEKEVWSSFTPGSFSQTLFAGDSRDTLKLSMTIKAKRIIPHTVRKVAPSEKRKGT